MINLDPISGAVTAVSNVIGGILDALGLDPEKKAAAKALLMSQASQDAIKQTQVDLSAIIAEAQSPDPWTSRARPSFLYIMYSVIILAFVGGIIGIWFPANVHQAALNISELLKAIPDSLWWLFGSGYLGYTGARSFDKWRSGAK